MIGVSIFVGFATVVLVVIEEHLRSIATLLGKIVDPDKGILRMVDVDRAKVYSTHLGEKLKGGQQ